MRKLMIIASMLLILHAQAQEKKAAGKPVFTSINTLGILEGQGGTSFTIQSINGIRLNTISIGAGVGLDYYIIRSVPVFLDVRKDLFSKRQTPFVYANAGTNLPWDQQVNYYEEVKVKGGLYYEAGLGYSWPLKSTNIIVSLGYSYKAFEEQIKSMVFCFDGNCPELNEKRAYQLRRLSIKAGFRF
jgi:hypothetical protein